MNNNQNTWHTMLQSKFKTHGCEVEVTVLDTIFKKCRRGDIINSNRDVLELQHSPISKQEVENRIQDYLLKGHPNIYWLIDGTNFTVIQRFDDRFLISLTSPWSHLSNLFHMCEFIFAHCKLDEKEFVFKFDPRSVRNGMVYVLKAYELEYFMQLFTNNNIEVAESIEPYRTCSLIVQQKPVGAGKTYGMVERIINPQKHPKFNHYENFFILLKPHSAKDVVRRELEEQLDSNNISYESGEENKGFWFTIEVEGKQKLIILATGDSFIYRIGDKHNQYLDMFKGICKMIETKGPSKLGEKGSLDFKGCTTKIDAKTLIICDEATKFDCHYAYALGQIMFWCMSDCYIIGDILQSIEMENNMLRYLIDTEDPIPHAQKHLEKCNVIRRFGPKLVEFLNTIVGLETYEKYGLPIPISCDDKTIQRDHQGDIEIMFANMRCDTEQNDFDIDQIIHKIEVEIHELYLLPNDILMVFPFVSNNPFGNHLRDRIDEFWISKLEDVNYRQHMLKSPYKHKASKFFEEFDTVKDRNRMIKDKYENIGQQYDWLAYFHRSEENKPVKTSDSDKATRMVSIHAAQGDGRRLVLTFQLSEFALKRFSNGRKNLIYDSLLNVSCSRAKTKQIIILQAGETDDIICRFKSFMTSEQLSNIVPKFILSNSFHIKEPIFDTHSNIADKEWILSTFNIDKCSNNKNEIIEFEHYLIRNATYHFVFTLCIHFKELNRSNCQIHTILCKIYELPIKQVNVSEYYKILSNPYDDLSCIPLIRYNGKHTICDDIFKLCNDIKSRILRLFVQKEKNINFKDINPLEYVLMWYMIEIFSSKRYSLLKMDTVVDIYSFYKIKYNHELAKHYNYIDKAQDVFNSIIKNLPTNGNWNFNHTISLGQPKGEYPEGGFKCRMKLPFVYTSDTSCIVIHIIPNVTSLRLDKITTIVSYTGLLLSQPYQDNSDNKISGKNKDRFKGKYIKIYMPSIEDSDENKEITMFEWNNITTHRHKLINVLSTWIFERCFSQHDNIIDFVKFYGYKSADEYENQCKKYHKNPVKYVHDMLKWYCEEYEYKTDNISKFQDTFKKRLDKKLTNTIECFKKSLG